ncbi:TULIP family P47-like protein [Bordetella genomosp. 5]|uniref:TULIP family P47-like protein n=1 Tax=Bordetella genomosp. 5 TaxID=1395608 RepID=UPI0015959644|nr:TULIP family P47-like protein [Bordetella genomosp. 5]
MSSLLQAPRRGVPTLGWDLVYAVEISHLNARIAAGQPAPRQFSSAYGEEISVEGTLGAWQIVPGGGADRIFLQIPILHASMRHADRIQTFYGSVTVSVSLAYVAEAEGHTLRIRSDRDDDKAAFHIERTDLGALCGLMGRSMVESSLHDWIATHAGAFRHALATIALDPPRTDAPHAWLKPTTISYAYADRPARGDGVLAILAMTNGRPGGHLKQQVMASVIADKQPAAMLISPHLLLDRLILPALALAYPGTQREDFEFVGDFPMLQLKAPRPLGVDQDDGLPAAPTLHSLTLSFTGNQFVCESETSLSDGVVTEHRRVLSRQVLRMQTDAEGRRRIAFVQEGEAEVHPWSTMHADAPSRTSPAPAWQPAMAGVVSLLVNGPVMLGGLALAALTGGLPPHADAEPADPSCGGPWGLPAEPLACDASRPFAWDGSASFALKSVDLAESLRFSGTPWPQA